MLIIVTILNFYCYFTLCWKIVGLHLWGLLACSGGLLDLCWFQQSRVSFTVMCFYFLSPSRFRVPKSLAFWLKVCLVGVWRAGPVSIFFNWLKYFHYYWSSIEIFLFK